MYGISIPVWYDYEKWTRTTTIPGLLFQFQYGTIMRSIFKSLSLVSAISIPVWYDYEDVQSSKSPADNLFQFQYGTIMRKLLAGSSGLENIFQFQYGTIMSKSFAWSISSILLISIPVWYDYEFLLSPCRFLFVPISIPVWYDYETDLTNVVLYLPLFQFQYGTIMR